METQYERCWNVYVDPVKSKWHFLRYVARYVRRPPIAQHRFTKITSRELGFLTKDLKEKRPALDRLMADAHRRKFDVVVVWFFARSVSHLLRILETFNWLVVPFLLAFSEEELLAALATAASEAFFNNLVGAF
jgi:hypothetical protein